jgi:hypothetical protein
MHQARSSEVASAQASALPHRSSHPATVEVYDLELRSVTFCAEDDGWRPGAQALFPEPPSVLATAPSGHPRPECPAVARRLIRAASTLRQRQCWDQAGHQALLAAWVCDDAGAARPGRACRRIAAVYWNKALACGMSLCGTAWYDDALLVEVLRRSGSFSRAAHACLGALQRTALDGMQHVLRFQLEHIYANDAGQHSMGEALSWTQRQSPRPGSFKTQAPFQGNPDNASRRMS